MTLVNYIVSIGYSLLFYLQVCNITIISWNYYSDQIILYPPYDMVDMTAYYPNEGWNLTHSSVTMDYLYVPEMNSSLPGITGTVWLKRQPKFFITNLLLPIFVRKTMGVVL